MFSERFLQLYNDELRYFREAGRQFASSHPQVAQHLGMHIDGVLDPFVERLLEGSAFLCTRIQEKLNNEQPEFALQMLSRLAPLWYTPVPAIATVAIKPDLSFPQWHSQVDLPRGSRMTLNDISLNNKPATFTTARHIKVQPVEIALAECEILPPHHLPDGAARHMQDCSAYVRIGLTTHGVLPVSELDLEPLHLTLAEDTVRANQLMAALLNRTLRIVLWAKTTIGRSSKSCNRKACVWAASATKRHCCPPRWGIARQPADARILCGAEPLLQPGAAWRAGFSAPM